MTATYLQVTVAVWGFLAATALGIVIHTVGTRRRMAAFDRHTIAMRSHCSRTAGPNVNTTTR